MSDLISREPCFACDDNVMERETGWRYCRAGDTDECPTWLAVQELEAKALASAEHWQTRVRHTPRDVRRDAILNEAGAYEQWAAELGAAFDADVWTAMCGVVRAGVAA